METKTGWLLDLYEDPKGEVILWLLADGGERLCLHMELPITFYAAGDFAILHRAWKTLQSKDVLLARTIGRDLFTGERDVMSITAANPVLSTTLFRELSNQFPELDYYNADIPISLRFIAHTGIHLLGRCKLNIEGSKVIGFEPLTSPWKMAVASMPLCIMELSLDEDPAYAPPKNLRIQSGRMDYTIPLSNPRLLLILLSAELRKLDPDLILTDYGDTWLFPKLTQWAADLNFEFNPNRDASQTLQMKREDSYFAYGRVVYRGRQALLYGRWHIDSHNSMIMGESGLEGVFEQVRVTGLRVQDVARKSPGAGITAMQMLKALQTGVMVPFQKQQAGNPKTLAELIRADRCGLVYQPITGIHRNVAQIDFSSMYPAIMVNHNISPETTGKPDAPEGLIPQTLRPLLEKRLAMKKLLTELSPNDCRRKVLKERAAALKWLLVVCFGYLGYKNARFGKLESHEAVTADSRDLLLMAKDIAEEMGFSVLHMYVDSLFVQKDGLQAPQDFAPLLEAIQQQTGLQIALDGVYRWVAFLPSKRDPRAPVANRYFGVFQDGEIKVRGIATRKHNTPQFISETQLGLLAILAQADEPADKIPEAQAYLHKQMERLKQGKVPLQDLVVSQTLSRDPTAYRVKSAMARAALQFVQMGRDVRPGMRMRFIYVRGEERVRAWGMPGDTHVDVGQYILLLQRAADEVLDIVQGENRLELLPMDRALRLLCELGPT